MSLISVGLVHFLILLLNFPAFLPYLPFPCLFAALCLFNLYFRRLHVFFLIFSFSSCSHSSSVLTFYRFSVSCFSLFSFCSCCSGEDVRCSCPVCVLSIFSFLVLMLLSPLGFILCCCSYFSVYVLYAFPFLVLMLLSPLRLTLCCCSS